MLVVILLSLSVAPCYAAESFGGGSFGGGTGRSDFFTWTNGFGGGSYGGGAGRDQSSAAYDDYVQTLPATGYTSAGKLVWQPKFSDFDPSSASSVLGYFSNGVVEQSTFRCSVLSSRDGLCFRSFRDDYSVPFTFSACKIKVPISGHYQQIKSIFVSGDFIGTSYYKEEYFSSSQYVESDSSFRWGYDDGLAWNHYGPGIVDIYFPVFEVTPALPLTGDTYNTTTRPTSITGGNYGVVGDNNEITKVQDNSTIINETNNTYYNPATGTKVPITNWSYDYSDRSYKVTLENGDTATVTYGDENISIVENTTVSGDTITNNYTIYYLVEGSGEPPTDCPHDWQKGDVVFPTCTLSGTVSYVCSLCGQVKIEYTPRPRPRLAGKTGRYHSIRRYRPAHPAGLHHLRMFRLS